MPTAPATMAALLFGFRTNQTIAAPVPATTGGYFQNGNSQSVGRCRSGEGEGLAEAVQGQGIDCPADFRLAAVEID